MLRASSHLSTLWLSCVFRSPTHQPPSTAIFRFLMKSSLRGDDPARQYSTPIINGLRPAGAGQTQGSCSPGVRPTLTIEDLGTSKPTSCTEFCVARIKSISPVSIDFVNPVIADHSIDFNAGESSFHHCNCAACIKFRIREFEMDNDINIHAVQLIHYTHLQFNLC